MKKGLKLDLISGLIAMVVTSLIYYIFINPPSTFNFIPYVIYNRYVHGNGSMNEGRFCLLFDKIFIVIVLFLMYIFIRKRLRNNS